ncbi:MAG: hypothetical protein II942_00780 [Alphaproteobacteria bacterium]|nr:hypothetical protein [Alphaproteobacteria bacterium]
MKKFLQKKWIGLVIVVLYAIFTAFFASKQLVPVLQELYPQLAQEAEPFLPITVTDGVITDPQNKVVTKTYEIDEENTFTITLDTRVEELGSLATTGPGMYITKKCVYAVTEAKTTTQCFEAGTTYTITMEDINELVGKLGNWTIKYLFWFLVVGLFVFMYVIILLYTILMHWLLAITFKVPFSQTLFINTLMYILLCVIVWFVQFDIKFLLTFGLLLAVNASICSIVKKQDA